MLTRSRIHYYLNDKHGTKIRFLIAGAANTAFGFSIYPLLYLLPTENTINSLLCFFDFPTVKVPNYLIILAISYLLSILFAYTTTKLIVFRTKGNYFNELLKFSTLHIIIFLINIIILPILVEKLNLSPLIAQPLFSLVTIITSYTWHRHITFSNKDSMQKIKKTSPPALNTAKEIYDNHRFHYMDGLRGLASLAVMLWHNFLAFFPGAIDPTIPVSSSILEKIIYRSPLNVFFAGDFSVYIFFILSGFCITVKNFSHPNDDLLKKSFLRRYFRLMPAACFTILLSYIILEFGLMFNKEVALINHSWWLTLNWKDVDISFKNALWTGLYGIWFSGISTNAHFNSNLGTLLIELLGSFVIYIFLIICNRSSNRYWHHAYLLLITAILMKNDPHWLVFFFGMMLADIYVNSRWIFDKITTYKYFFIMFGVFLGSANIGNIPDGNSTLNIYHTIEIVFRKINLHPLNYPWAIGAISLVTGIILSPKIQAILELKPFKLLGEYSYALFLIHTIFLGSVTCYLVYKLSILNYFSYTTNVMISILISLPLLIFITHIVKKIDDFAIQKSRFFS